MLNVSAGFNNYIQNPYSYGSQNQYSASGTIENGEKEDEKYSSEAEEKAAKRSGVEECETCKNRKYQDGSDENVSFKSASHISPQAAGARVRGHEAEHVANAYDKAEQEGGKVISAAVSIHTSVCPECGRTYVSGGTTTTQIMYNNESNPYQQARKSEDAANYTGMNVDLMG